MNSELSEEEKDLFTQFAGAFDSQYFAIPTPKARYIFQSGRDLTVTPPAKLVRTQVAPPIPLPPPGPDGSRDQWEMICDGIELFMYNVKDGPVVSAEPLLGNYHRVDDLGRLAEAATREFSRTGDPFFEGVARVAQIAAKFGLIIAVDY